MKRPVRTLDCDVLVIGSGPGGATTACLLAEAGRDVLLVEEGANLRLDSAPSYSVQEMEQKYRNAGLTMAFGRVNVTYIEGRTVGGASEINAALYHRPLPETLREWALKYQIDDFGPRELDPFFDEVERELSVSTMPEGVGPASEALRAGAKKLGWKSTEIARFWKYTKGADGKLHGRRQSMSETLVPRALAAGARLLPDTRIRRLAIEGNAAVAAEGRTRGPDGDEPVRIRFRDVFVCGGAVQTPLLLRRSGLTHLVGDALRIHPMVRIAVRFPKPVNDPSFGVPVVQIEEFKPHLTLGCSHSSMPHVALWLGDNVPDRERLLEEWPTVAVFYAAVTGSGKGKVRALPFFDEPLVRYPVTDQDLALLGEGLHRLGQLVFAAGATEIFSPIAGAPSIRDADGAELLRTNLPADKLNITTIHLFSSCPMGEDGRFCPTDSWGRLRGWSNIHVNDASLLPNTPGVNPQGTILAIARRNAYRHLERTGG